jgi:nitrite reductase (NADH) small subunit
MSAPHNLGPAVAIPRGEGRTFAIGSTALAVFRTRNGEVYATQAECPHRGGPLADGMIGAATVVCPLHAFKFDLASGCPIGHECGALCTHPVSVAPNGDLIVHIESG